jgi:hypothetical protein
MSFLGGRCGLGVRLYIQDEFVRTWLSLFGSVRLAGLPHTGPVRAAFSTRLLILITCTLFELICKLPSTAADPQQLPGTTNVKSLITERQGRGGNRLGELGNGLTGEQGKRGAWETGRLSFRGVESLFEIPDEARKLGCRVDGRIRSEFHSGLRTWDRFGGQRANSPPPQQRWGIKASKAVSWFLQDAVRRLELKCR